MSRAEVNQVIMKNRMSLIIKGVPNSNPESFTINVGESKENIALYCNVSFAENRVILNSKKDGHFGQQKTIQNFPFKRETEFEMTITLQGDTFDVTLPDGYVAKFTTPLTGIDYNRIWVEDDVTINGISLM